MEGRKLPILSVWMTTYNHEKYIGEAIESVINQKTDFLIELVIGEDCSTDGTRAICIDYRDKYPEIIKLLLPDKNLGMMLNGIKTLEACEGKYIAILEGDDYWKDQFKIQKQVDFLEENKDYGLVFTDADVLYQSTNKLIKSYDKTFNRKIPTGDVLKVLIQGNPYKTCTSLFRRDLIQDIIDLNILSESSFGDKSLWMHLASKSKVGYIPESTAVYRVLDSSASHFLKLSDLRRFFKSIYKTSLYYSNYYNLPIDKKALKKHYRRNIINYCIEKKIYKELLPFYKDLDLIVFLLLKERLVRPLFKYWKS